MLRFTFLGFPVSIHWMFWLVAFLWGNHTQGDPQALMLWIAAFFLSIFWHELGHAFLYRHYGARPSISLHGIGGTCYGHGYTPIGNHRLKEILISFAGPAFGLALAAAAWLIIRQLTGKAPEFSLYSGTTPLLKFATYLFVINLFLNLLNLLPVLPLDGGQIMQAILGPTARKKALLIAIVTSILVVVYALNAKQIFMALLFGYLAYQNYMTLQGKSAPNLLAGPR